MLGYLLAYNETDVVPFLDAINVFRKTILSLCPYDAITNCVSIANVASTLMFYRSYERQFDIIYKKIDERGAEQSKQDFATIYKPEWLNRKSNSYLNQDNERFNIDPVDKSIQPKQMMPEDILKRIIKGMNLCFHCGCILNPAICTLD